MNEFGALLGRQFADDLRNVGDRFRLRRRQALRLQRCVNIEDLRTLARRATPRAIFDFVDGAAGDELTAARNQSGWRDITLVPRVLNDLSEADISTTILGQSSAVPFVGAPTGLTGLSHCDGELGTARAMAAVGGIYVLSAMGSYTIEEVADGSAGTKWFQVYPWRDRGLVADLIDRARTCGYSALVLTVDVPRAGARERDFRNGFGIPPRVTLRSLVDGAIRPRWSADFVMRPRMKLANVEGYSAAPANAVSLTDYISTQFDPSFDWGGLAWIRERWEGPLVLKGILHEADALTAVRAGADAVCVSNHGGRQFDTGPATATALPAIVEAVGDSAEVYVDGGIRRGSDIAAALAVGARACLIGRPLVYGLAAGGSLGATRAAEILAAEARLAATLIGCDAISNLSSTWILSPDSNSPDRSRR